MNKNGIITLSEAERILQFAKRIYPLLNGVFIEYGNEFAYYPNEFKITIPEEFVEEHTGMKILKHVNEEFGATFEYNLREMSIQALLHECGHHMDFEGKIFVETCCFGSLDSIITDNGGIVKENISLKSMGA